MHVKTAGLGAADDGVIWNYAKENGFALVSRDSDFHQRSLVFGHPPKFIFMRVGNVPTRLVVELLQANHAALLAFNFDEGSSILIIS